MIFIGLGSNLSGDDFDSPHAVLAAALSEMPALGITIVKTSPFYRSAPVPKSDQPWFVNAVAAVETELAAPELLQRLHDIEALLGRRRRVKWEARIIDLDIIAYHDQIWPSKELPCANIIIPHPRMRERLFVLKPLMDICPHWQHPLLHKSIARLVDAVEKNAEQALQLSSPVV